MAHIALRSGELEKRCQIGTGKRHVIKLIEPRVKQHFYDALTDLAWLASQHHLGPFLLGDLNSYGLCSYGLSSHGLNSYDLSSDGLRSYGLSSYGLYCYDLSSYDLNSYGLSSYGLSSYDLSSYSLSSYGLSSYDLNSYDLNSYGLKKTKMLQNENAADPKILWLGGSGCFY